MNPKEGEIRFTDYGNRAHVWRNGNWEPYTPQKDVVVIDLLDDLQDGNRTMEVLKQITAEEAKPKVGASIPGSMMSSTFVSLGTAPVPGQVEFDPGHFELLHAELKKARGEFAIRQKEQEVAEFLSQPVIPPNTHVQPGDVVLDPVEQFKRQRRAVEQGLGAIGSESFNLTRMFNKLRGM